MENFVLALGLTSLLALFIASCLYIAELVGIVWLAWTGRIDEYESVSVSYLKGLEQFALIAMFALLVSSLLRL